MADAPGDWILHCHKSHHTMNAMSHDVPNMIGVKQAGVEEKVRHLLPGYMAMGETGMGGMMDMGTPRNTLPMMSGQGPFGAIEMGGMFTVLKVRDGLAELRRPRLVPAPAGHGRAEGHAPVSAPQGLATTPMLPFLLSAQYTQVASMAM